MPVLPSGLAELVADEEDLARFLTSSSQFNGASLKPSALLPNPKTRDTSVFRQAAKPSSNLWALADAHLGEGRKCHGAAVFRARHVREASLDVLASEPPARHANIVGWAWAEDDPELAKARHKELALRIGQEAEVVRR